MIITLLGFVSAIAFFISGVPLAWTVYKTPKLVGFSKIGWIALSTALVAVTIQLALLSSPLLLLGATAFNTLVVGFVTVQTLRKGD